VWGGGGVNGYETPGTKANHTSNNMIKITSNTDVLQKQIR